MLWLKSLSYVRHYSVYRSCLHSPNQSLQVNQYCWQHSVHPVLEMNLLLTPRGYSTKRLSGHAAEWAGKNLVDSRIILSRMSKCWLVTVSRTTRSESPAYVPQTWFFSWRPRNGLQGYCTWCLFLYLWSRFYLILWNCPVKWNMGLEDFEEMGSLDYSIS
jgi:hypothetical protein